VLVTNVVEGLLLDVFGEEELVGFDEELLDGVARNRYW
jgi:hypothetical protein